MITIEWSNSRFITSWE